MNLSKEIVMERNLALAEAHLLQILEQPRILERIPNDAHIIFLPVNDQGLFEANLETANHLARELSGNGSHEPIVLFLLPMAAGAPMPT